MPVRTSQPVALQWKCCRLETGDSGFDPQALLCSISYRPDLQTIAGSSPVEIARSRGGIGRRKTTINGSQPVWPTQMEHTPGEAGARLSPINSESSVQLAGLVLTSTSN
jgi:hypothetical protein